MVVSDFAKVRQRVVKRVCPLLYLSSVACISIRLNFDRFNTGTNYQLLVEIQIMTEISEK